MIEVLLEASRSELHVGEPADLRIRVRNRSSQRLLVPGVLDGSEFAARYPHYLPQIEGGGPRELPEVPDFTAPLRKSDFRSLAPGESFDPTDRRSGGAFLPIVAFQRLTHNPGRYAVSLLFSTESASPDEWLGNLPSPRDPSVLELIASVPRLTVRSNVLRLHVV